MAGVAYVSEKTFETEVTQFKGPVLVDFTATWCGPCKAIAPLLDKLSAAHGSKIKVVKLDIDDNPNIAQRFNVMSIPTLIIFNGKDVKARQVGAVNEAKLNSFVSGVVGPL